MRPILLTLLMASALGLGGCNKPTPVESTTGTPTATIATSPPAAMPASSPASDPSVPAAANVVSTPGSSASAP